MHIHKFVTISAKLHETVRSNPLTPDQACHSEELRGGWIFKILRYTQNDRTMIGLSFRGVKRRGIFKPN